MATRGSRRDFVQAGAAAALSASAARGAETLAVDGGRKAVQVSAERVAQITKWPRFSDEEKRIVSELLDNNRFYQEIPMLEDELKNSLGAPFVKAHCNGTGGLLSAFFALDLPKGSEILAPSYTAWATTAPMHLFGYVPRFVDINPRTMTFDLDDAKKRLTPQTRAVMVMHSAGNPCDMDQICAFAKERGLAVVEDACQAQGASLQNKAMGTWGAIGVFSFQSSKILPAIEGGAGVYQTRDYYERATLFGNYELPSSFPAESQYRTYAGTGMGPKLRIHPLAAAIARRQLRKMEESNTLVDAQVRQLTDRLVELPGISRPYCRPDAKRVYWGSHVLFLDEAKAGCPKDALMKALRAEGVQINPGAYDEQHKYRLYSEAKWWHHPVTIPEDLHGTTWVNKTAVKLPLFREKAPDLVEQYVQAFEKVWARRASLQKA
ncbi:MAG: aminotransferase class V-fold PLP-dependent enzyme [Bryobacterales bacterium]|nr:aminotransferase class V-fold PLP-dependent enzyme [Bryobacterales bacterium]